MSVVLDIPVSAEAREILSLRSARSTAKLHSTILSPLFILYSILVNLSIIYLFCLILCAHHDTLHCVQLTHHFKRRMYIMTYVVSNRLSTLLGEKRMSISEASRRTGISRTTLTNLYYEKGGAISFPVLAQLCVLLNCGVGDILYTREVG